MPWDSLGLSERARDVVHRMGWRAPTPIQQAALPHLLKGKDVVAEAETGSGKTGAFGLALSDTVRGPGLRALVLVPTRELAQQVTADVNALAEGAPFRAAAVYGGVPFEPQLAALADPATTCAVATPGRLLDFLGMQKVSLANVAFVVVDEADRLFDLGFLKDVERILADLPRGRQIALFSATFPDAVLVLTRRHMISAKHVQPEGRPTVPESSEHFRVDVPSSQKREALSALLKAEDPRMALVFGRTRQNVKDLERWLRDGGFEVASLHGDLAQPQREGVLARFREGEIRVLVATDVAARGLDVAGISHVVNYDVPEEPDAYVHRSGRTARAGRPGRVFTIVTEKDHASLVRAIEGSGAQLRRLRLEGFVAPERDPVAFAAQQSAIPRKRKADKKRLKPGWERRKGRR